MNGQKMLIAFSYIDRKLMRNLSKVPQFQYKRPPAPRIGPRSMFG